MEMVHLTNKEFKVMAIKMLTKLRRTMNDMVKISTKKKYKKVPIRNKEKITEMKTILKGINSRLDDKEE